mgnify:FL=1
MGKGIIALILEALLFLFFYTHWNPLFEEQREQERYQSVLNSVTTDMCKQGLDSYLKTCKGLQNPIVNSFKVVSKDIEASSVNCKIEGEIVFSYNGRKYNGTFNAEGSTDSIASDNTVYNMSFFNGIHIRDRKNNFSLQFDYFGDIVVPQLKIGESVKIDGIKCLFERKWDSGEWLMKTSKILTPVQMYKVYNNPKCKNPDGIRFSTNKFLLYGFVKSNQILVSKENGDVYRYSAYMDDNYKKKKKRID